MKFTYLKLQNFAGIYAGMKQKEIEINLETKNSLIMLLADNGKGKTVIQSSLSPFRESLDGRTDLILPGELGYKEIHLVSGKDKYIIKHYYGETSKQNKSFISKNGEELNENGGQRTFNTTVENELGVTKDYFKIARLGANVDTFVNLNSNDRKKYISSFIPDIDDILESFNKAKDTYNALNKEMKKLENSLNKIGDKEVLEEQNENLAKDVKDEEEIIQKLKSEMYLYNKKLDDVDVTIPELQEILKELNNELNEKTKVYNKSTKTLETIYKKYPKLKDYTLEKAKKVYDSNKDKRSEIKNEIELNNVRINGLNDKLAGFTINKLVEFNEEELTTLNEKAEDFRSKITELNESIGDNIEIKHTEDELIEMKNKLNNELDAIKVIVDNTDRFIIDQQLNRVNLIDLDARRSRVEAEIHEYTRIIQNIEGRKNTAKLVKQRPSDCNIDTCPFISAAIEANNDMKNLDKLYKHLESIKDELIIIENRIEEGSKVKVFHDSVMELETKYKRNNILQLIYDNTYMDKYEKAIKQVDGEITCLRNIEQRRDYKTLLESIERNICSLDRTKEKNRQLSQQNKEAQKKYDECKEKIACIIAENNVNNKDIDKINKKMAILSNLIDGLENQEARLEDINKTKECITKRETVLLDMKAAQTKIKELTKEIDRVHTPKLELYKKRYEDNKAALIEAKTLTKRMNEINKNFANIKLIKDSLDPKSGIPMVFIETFLTDISEKTNKLLDIAYDGKFQINFELTDRDFFIQVLKSDGTVLRDIKDCSQGEFSMTMISLSLAMLERNISKYNIVYLDEVDATLSTENRRTFIEILQAQIATLGIEQVFVISHNQEFHSYPLGLILLEGYDIDVNDPDVMENKDVLYKIG